MNLRVISPYKCYTVLLYNEAQEWNNSQRSLTSASICAPRAKHWFSLPTAPWTVCVDPGLWGDRGLISNPHRSKQLNQTHAALSCLLPVTYCSNVIVHWLIIELFSWTIPFRFFFKFQFMQVLRICFIYSTSLPLNNKIVLQLCNLWPDQSVAWYVSQYKLAND